jgi:hypothetical protein
VLEYRGGLVFQSWLVHGTKACMARRGTLRYSFFLV